MPHFEIRIPQSEIEGWSTRPGSRKTRCQMGRSDKSGDCGSGTKMRANLKTWPATPVEASLEIDGDPGTTISPQLLLSKRGAAGVGGPSRTEVGGQISEIIELKGLVLQI